MTPVLLSAAVLGLVSSPHCFLMCGPLAVTGCITVRGSRGIGTAAYLLGRLVGYAFAGSILGHMGAPSALGHAAPVLQTGAILLVSALALIRGATLICRREGPLAIGPGRPWDDAADRGRGSHVVLFLASLLPRHPVALGLITSILPCGLLGMVWVLAASTGNPQAGAAVMLVFALATSPALVAGVLLTRPLARLVASPLTRGVLWCILGLWLMLRGVLPTPCPGGHRSPDHENGMIHWTCPGRVV